MNEPELHVGDVVRVTDPDGKTARYLVTRRQPNLDGTMTYEALIDPDDYPQEQRP